ncbi:DNA cytosine methyltransferase [Halorutilales archaeon Cl-col2-1]
MKAIDLFCGCGGFSRGFEMAGIDVTHGIDIDEDALSTFSHNHPSSEAINHDISDGVLDTVRDDFDLVFGSPPCQGFSHAKGEREEGDERNSLVFSFTDWVDEIQPEYVVMENVAGIRNISDGFLDTVRDEYRDMGYEVCDGVLNSAEYGVPQKRERYFLLGVKESEDASPSLPSTTHRLPGDTQTTLDDLDGSDTRDAVLVGDAITDLPEVTQDGVVTVDTEPGNVFQRWVRDGDTVENHTARLPTEDDIDLVRRIPEGKMYRSSRFGEKYVQAWDLYDDVLTDDEQHVLWFVSRHRTRKKYKATDGSGPDYVPIERIDADPEVVRSLYDDGWLRRKTEYNGYDEAYDINTKSGVRPKYMRLDRHDVSNTLDTQSFNPREKLHPTEDRGLSLREGARIQGFPDDFVFRGSFKSIAQQIGNAVPPLLAYKIARHLLSLSGDEIPEKKTLFTD